MPHLPSALSRALVAALTLLTVPLDGGTSSGKKKVQADAGSWVKRFKPVYLDTA